MNRKLKYLLVSGLFIGSLLPINVFAEKVNVVIDGKNCTIETKPGEITSTDLDNAGKHLEVKISESGTVNVGSQNASNGFTKEKIYQDQNGNPILCLAAGKIHEGNGTYTNDLALEQQWAWDLSGCTNSTSGNCGYGAMIQMGSAISQGIDMGGLSASNYYGKLSASEIQAAVQQAVRYHADSKEGGLSSGNGQRAKDVYADAQDISSGNLGNNYCGTNCGSDKTNAIYSLAVDLYNAATQNGGISMNGSAITVLWAKIGDSWQPFMSTENVKQEDIEDIECEDDSLTCPLNPTGGPGDCDGGGEAEDPEMCAILAPVTSGTACSAAWRYEAKYTYMGSGSSTRAGGYFKHNVSGASGSELSTKVELTKQGTGVLDYEQWKEAYLSANMAVASAWSNMTMWWSIDANNPSPSKQEPNGDVCGGCQSNVCAYRNGMIYYWENYSPHGHCNASKYSVSCSIDAHTASDGSRGSVQDYLVPDYEAREACEKANKKNGTNNRCDQEKCGTSSVTRQATPGDINYVKKQKEAATNGYIGALNARAKLLETLQDCYFMSSPQWYKGRSYETAMGGHATKVTLGNYAETMNISIPTSGFNLDYAHNGSDGAYISTGVTTAGPSAGSIQHDNAKKEEICAGCSGNLDELGGDSFEEIPFFFCSGGYTGVCRNEPINVSKSSTTTMKAKAEIGVYQSASFSTEIYTGKLTNNGGGVGYLSLPSRVWPVPSTALSGTYPSTSTVPAITTQYGRLPGGTVVCPYNVTNELTKFDCDYDYHVCYPCEGEGCNPDDGPNIDLGVYFRAIDLNDVFPESQYSPQNQNSLTGVTRRIGSNWTTSNAVEVIKEIQKLNDQVWFETPQYTVTLNPATRAKIKKYNKNTSYLDNSVNCEGLNCSSKFLDIELKEMLGDKYENLYIKDKTIPNSALYNYKR